MKKKAFTLTELLVVVVIIGVLSAVVLPKFTKVLEARKVGEAEEVMAAIRTEQEARCALDKKYTTSKNNLAVYPKNEGSNYTYELLAGGMKATSKSEGYTLQIKSYQDGKICCQGDYCTDLNKGYVDCNNYTPAANRDCEPQEVNPELQPEPEPEPEVNPEPEPDEPSCEVPAQTTDEQPCGCNNTGTQTRTFNKSLCEWGEWGACSVSEECTCEEEGKPAATQVCNECGEQTRTVTCNPGTGAWETGDWSDCSKTTQECAEEECNFTRTRTYEWYATDTCDGDNVNMYSCNGVNEKKECLDIYMPKTQSNSGSGSPCSGDSYLSGECINATDCFSKGPGTWGCLCINNRPTCVNMVQPGTTDQSGNEVYNPIGDIYTQDSSMVQEIHRSWVQCCPVNDD